MWHKRRTSLENNTEIQYIIIKNKIYHITDLSLYRMQITAVEVNTPAAELPEYQIFDYDLFKGYHIKLINNNGQAEIIDFEGWKSKNCG